MKKFGTFSGVFIPSFEAILGAVLFLLLPHLVGEMGLVQMLAIIVIANLITTATAFSISDCTSSAASVGSGGMYAISKRSLGKAFGGSIGIQLYLAQAASIGFYAMGFATPLQELLRSVPLWNTLSDGWNLTPLMEKQVLASLLACTGLIAALIGSDFVSRLQLLIFVILSLSVGAFFLSPVLGITTGGQPLYTRTVNWNGAGTAFTFFVALTTFFPAVTGIDAGVGMSGLLKNPRKSLFRGTFAAIAVTFCIYAGLAVLFSFINPGVLVRTAEGTVPSVTALFTTSPVLYALLMTGIMVATASSALSYFVTAPQTAQALAADDVLPRFMNVLGRDFTRRGKEPRVATLLTFLIVMAVIWSGDVDASARLVGIAFLVVYGWINLVAFFERVSGNPGFRPEHQLPWVIGFAGFAGSLIIIALDNPVLGVSVLAAQFLTFHLILRYKAKGQMEGVWWGLLFTVISWTLARMRRIIQGTRNWRPLLSVFVFADQPETAGPTILLSRRIANFKGMVALNVLPGALKDPASNPWLPGDARILSDADDPSLLIPAMTQMALPSGLSFNSILIAEDARLNMALVMERVISHGQNLLLYKAGHARGLDENRIDLWWKGEANGNFMALLAHIMLQSDELARRRPATIRFIRKLSAGQDVEAARTDLLTLIETNNLDAEALVLPPDDQPFLEAVHRTSADASLILMGMPGQSAGTLAKVFRLDKLFFDRELGKYDDLPPILFVKAAGVMTLMD